MDHSDALIVGGGFTGLATAMALARQGRTVTVLEARTGKNPAFRGELLHPPGVQGLRELGLFAGVRARGGVEVTGFAVIPDERAPAVELPYEPPPLGMGNGFAVDHHELVDAMRDAVCAHPLVRLHLGARVTDVVREGGRVRGVRTADAEYRAPLTLVCEGRLSRLRATLGIVEDSRLLSYTAALLARGAALPYPGHGHVVIGPPGPVLAYPIGGAVRLCIDMPLDTPRGRDAIAQRLRRDYAPRLPAPIADAVHAALDRDAFELCATQQVRTGACVVPVAGLVGDAGGCSHPITAAGMTNSLNDVRALASELLGVYDENGVDLALGRYERRRYRYVRAREMLSERLYDVFLARDEGMRALRSGMLSYWKDTARARVASMALLSGQRSDLGAFAKEFAVVFGYATAGALRHGSGALRERASAFARLTDATRATLSRAASTAVREMLR
ncbi:MAG: NAD(P)/FAD-dependent oxidoreductase [Polyangiales bacterium]